MRKRWLKNFGETKPSNERIPNDIIIKTENGENYCHIQGDVTDFEIDRRSIRIPADDERWKTGYYTVVTITIKPYSEEG